MATAFRIERPATAFSKSPVGTKKRPRENDEKHLSWIRTLPCILTGKRPVEACHVRYPDPRFNKREVGAGEKPSDRWVVPMCPGKHRQQHAQNERSFWLAHDVDPVVVAAALFAVSGDDEAAEVILREARRK